MSNTPTLSEVLAGAVAAGMGQHYSALPGRVESFDPTTQRVSVQPLIKRGVIDESGERQAESLTMVTEVPVCFPGAGDYSITFPIAAGDIVLLIFASGSLDKWLSVGGEVDPLDDRRHTLSDAIAIPGLRAAPNAIPVSGTHATAMVISASLIHAGGTQELALASELEELRDYVHDQFSGTGHGHPAPGGATTGTTPTGTAPAGPYDGTSVLKGG